jgi:hypothetical protein
VVVAAAEVADGGRVAISDIGSAALDHRQKVRTLSALAIRLAAGEGSAIMPREEGCSLKKKKD